MRKRPNICFQPVVQISSLPEVVREMSQIMTKNLEIVGQIGTMIRCRPEEAELFHSSSSRTCSPHRSQELHDLYNRWERALSS